MKGKFTLLRAVMLVALSVFFLIFSGCAVASILTQFGYVKGIVTDSVTGENISGVYVSTYDYYYSDDYDYTNSDGSYVLTLAGGTYDIRFEKDGYRDVRLYDITVISPFTKSLDVAMEPIDPSPTPSPTPGDWDYLYATNSGGSNKFSAFYVEKNTGELSLDASSPVNTGQGPAGILKVDSQNLIYVANSTDRTISIYNGSGTYTQIQGSPVSLSTTNGFPHKMAYDSTGSRIFITMRDSSSPGVVEMLNISNPASPYSEGAISASELAADPRDIEINTASGHVYIASKSGNAITAFDTRDLTTESSVTFTDPSAIALATTGNILYAIGGSTKVLSVFDVSDPANIQKTGTDTTVTTDSNRSVVACELASDRNLLFTLESGSSGSVLKAWDISSGPPYSQAQGEFYLGNSTATDLVYDSVNQFLFVCHNGSGSDGIHVFSLRNYPSGQITEVYGSPFFQGNQYYMLGR